MGEERIRPNRADNVYEHEQNVVPRQKQDRHLKAYLQKMKALFRNKDDIVLLIGNDKRSLINEEIRDSAVKHEKQEHSVKKVVIDSYVPYEHLEERQ